ncbi:MAG TPA: pyridoxal phosphate-dependent aminotransferase [bacterium]
MQIAKSMANLGQENAFEVLAKAKALEAKGIDMIHMEIGEPDFNTPQYIKDAAIQALQDGHTHYVASKGIPEVRHAFAEYIAETRNIPCTQTEIVVTPGAKPIVFFGLLATINPGDEVVYPDPGYPIYKSVIDFLGAKAVPLPLKESVGFRFQHDDLYKAVNEKTKMIIINSPQNPTGGVLTEDDLNVIADVAKEFDCWVMTDEVYSRILYDGHEHKSIVSIPGMLDRTIMIEGHSKTYAMTGWRLGYGVMPEGVASHVTRLMNNSNSCTAAFTQLAGVAAYEGPQDEVEAMRQEFEERRDIIVDGLNSIEHVKCEKPLGAFYVFPNFKEYGWDSADIETYLLQNAHVATLAGTSFGKFGEGYIRLSYACSKEQIEKAIERIRDAMKNLPPLETYKQTVYA